MKKQKEKKKRTIGDVVRTIVMLVALCAFLYSGYQLFTIYQEYKEGNDEYGSLEDQYVQIPGGLELPETSAGDLSKESVKEGQKEEEMESPVDFPGLLAVNKDIIGWIHMEALDISYPIAQGKDNEYYLHNTIQKTYNFAGSVFMDYECKSDFTGKNSIIYGHNMRDGSMFGTLKQFREQETLDKSPYFWIYTPKMNYRYKIFSCHEVGAVSNSYQFRFKDDKTFKTYLQEAVDHTVVKTDTNVSVKDKIVTLSTCTGNEATRFIVQGRLVNAIKTKEK